MLKAHEAGMFIDNSAQREVNALRRLIRDCRKMAADRHTPAEATALLQTAASALEATLPPPGVRMAKAIRYRKGGQVHRYA